MKYSKNGERYWTSPTAEICQRKIEAEEFLCAEIKLWRQEIQRLKNENTKLRSKLYTAEQRVHDLRSSAMDGEAC